jgi:hypothetical protein
MLGAYVNPDKTTRKLDQLAPEGMQFDRAYGSPVCTPTRVSLDFRWELTSEFRRNRAGLRDLPREKKSNDPQPELAER